MYFLLDLVDELDLSAILIPAQAKDPRGEKGFDPRMGSAPPSGVTQEVLCPFLESEQEKLEYDFLEADCAAPFIHYEP